MVGRLAVESHGDKTLGWLSGIERAARPGSSSRVAHGPGRTGSGIGRLKPLTQVAPLHWETDLINLLRAASWYKISATFEVTQ